MSATSDRIRGSARGNVVGGRMLAEADTTPEFLIRRNLILRKRSTSGSDSEDVSAQSWPSEPFKSDAAQHKKAVHPTGHHARDVDASPLSTTAAAAAPPQLRTNASWLKTHEVVRGSGPTLSLTSKGLGIMGEESCCDHVRSAAAEQTPRNADNDQEFRYGPGFVDKLKSRFISLSLQEKTKSAPSDGGGIRRYSSLENVLEQDDYLDCAKRKRPIGTSAYANGRAPGYYAAPRKNSFKRAKSMETLLLQSEDNMRHRNNVTNTAFSNSANNNNRLVQRPLSACDPLPGSVLINENLVIIESLQPKDSELNSKVSKKKGPARQVSVSSINDEELPKPDIVKQCKLIFETASKRPGPHGGVRKTPVVRQSAKTSVKGLTTQLPGKVLQPPNNQAQPQQQPNFNNNNANLISVAQQKLGAKDVPCIVNGDAAAPPHPESPTESESKTISGEALGRIRSQGSTVTFNGCQKGKPPATKSASSFHAVKPSSPPPPPPVTATKSTVRAQELESKNQQAPTQNVEPVKLVPAAPNGPLPAPPPPPPPPPPSSFSTTSESERAMRVSSKSVVSQDVKFSEPSNDDTSEEDSDDSQEEFLKPTALLGRSKPGGLWQKTPPPSNTVVYDFRGKEVKSHLPTNPAPFGCKPAKKAKKQGKPDPATTLVLGNFGGESRDYDEDYDSDELDIGAHLPALSGITFVGENTKCVRSSLLTTRNKKLKIHFVEKATTHEYPAAPTDDQEGPWPPSETNGHLTNGELPVGAPDGALPPTPTDPDQDEDEADKEQDALRHQVTAPILRQNMAVASTGGLSRYTPSMLSSSSESIQLGVERLVPEENGPIQGDATHESNGKDASSSEGPEEEELKPGDPADMSSWSSSTSTSDLLF